MVRSIFDTNGIPYNCLLTSSFSISLHVVFRAPRALFCLFPGFLLVAYNWLKKDLVGGETKT